MKKLWIVLPVLAIFIAGGAYLFWRGTHPDPPANVHMTASTRNYSLLLALAPPQEMYTPEQVKEKHPTSGEEMFSGAMVMPGSGGSMAGMSGMSGSGSDGWRHVEVHIYTRGSNHVVTDAHPSITVRDDATGKETQLPIVTMQGVAIGTSDFHYGNNAYVPSGQQYTITVKVDADTATFHVRL